MSVRPARRGSTLGQSPGGRRATALAVTGRTVRADKNSKRVVPFERLGRLSLRLWGTSKIEQRRQPEHDANDRGEAQNFCKHVFPLLEAMKKDGGNIPILLPQNMGIN
ncbi:MAG: hypothetical protein ACREX3_15660 [Gammaproteobacteria bacterium]